MVLTICLTFGSSRWPRLSDQRFEAGSLCRTARVTGEQNIRVGLERVSQDGRLGSATSEETMKGKLVVFRNIKIAGLCLASMLVMGMALAGNASAVPLLWLVCLKSEGPFTKYTGPKCLESESSSTGKWQSLGVQTEKSITVKITVISIKLVDKKALIANSGAVCSTAGSVGEGLIEAGGKGKIRVAHVNEPTKNCKGVGGCEEVKKLEGVHLPWDTAIVEGATGPLTQITNSGAGKPGWAVECKTALGTKTDTCEEESKPVEAKLTFGEVTESPENGKELLVRALFEEKEETLGECTEGGKKSGLVLGTVAILLPGGALSIHKE
jgi:hypothetical protein